MSAHSVPTGGQEPAQVPEPGTLMVDVPHDRIGEFRGEWCGRWHLRPITGGTEWVVTPEDAHPASPGQRLRAESARTDTRRQGELLPAAAYPGPRA